MQRREDQSQKTHTYANDAIKSLTQQGRRVIIIVQRKNQKLNLFVRWGKTYLKWKTWMTSRLNQKLALQTFMPSNNYQKQPSNLHLVFFLSRR
jgi:hypothetical protein